LDGTHPCIVRPDGSSSDDDTNSSDDGTPPGSPIWTNGNGAQVPSPTNKFLVHKFIRILNYCFHYIFFILQKKTSAQKENIRGLLFALGFKSRLFLLVVGRLSKVAPLLFYRMLQVPSPTNKCLVLSLIFNFSFIENTGDVHSGHEEDAIGGKNGEIEENGRCKAAAFVYFF